ncbi:MAG: 3'-5' exonuclease [Phycisphaerales bacterium]
MLTTFSVQLARLLRQKMDCLVGADTEVRRRIVVRSLDELGLAEYERAFGHAKPVTPAMLRKLLRDAASDEDSGAHSLDFLVSEWNEVVDAWQLDTWEAYRDVARLGRRTRLPESRRRALWDVFERVRQSLQSQGLVTAAMVFGALTSHASTGEHAPADHVVVDEAQDVSVPQLRYLAAIAGGRPNGLFFAGDVGQQIFRTPFSWVSLGVDVRGRSQTLRVNYRTSHQIRRRADLLLDRVLSDVDGASEDRSGTVSVLSGPEPEVFLAESAEREAGAIGEWIRARLQDGVRPTEVLVVVRSPEEMPRAKTAAKAAGFEGVELRSDGVQPENTIALCTMHEAKGLEFRAVVVAACDDEVVPSQARISSVTDGADLQAVYETERHLLYVACTRARDHLLVTAVEPASEFLDDLRAEQ